MSKSQLSVEEMMEAGLHFGHQTFRRNPKMNQYIFGVKDGIHVIDLTPILYLWADAVGRGWRKKREAKPVVVATEPVSPYSPMAGLVQEPEVAEPVVAVEPVVPAEPVVVPASAPVVEELPVIAQVPVVEPVAEPVAFEEPVVVQAEPPTALESVITEPAPVVQIDPVAEVAAENIRQEGANPEGPTDTTPKPAEAMPSESEIKDLLARIIENRN